MTDDTAKIDIPTWVRVVIGVVLFTITVFGAAWGASRDNTESGFILKSHENRLNVNDAEVTDIKENISQFKIDVDKRFDLNEKMALQLENDQTAILNGQKRIEDQFTSESKIRREDAKEQQNKMESLTKSVTELNSYLKTIDTIN